MKSKNMVFCYITTNGRDVWRLRNKMYRMLQIDIREGLDINLENYGYAVTTNLENLNDIKPL